MGWLASLGGGLAAGALLWSATEYAVHRWVMHGPHTTNPVTAEHLDHHRHLERTDPLGVDRFLWWPAAGGLAVGLSAAAVVSARAAAGAAMGFATCYCGYRHLHWSIHHRPPRTRWGRSTRRHHLQHHIGAPRANHGVTTPVWDHVLGTRHHHPGPLVLPAGLAPAWLRGPDGSPRRDLAEDFTIR